MKPIYQHALIAMTCAIATTGTAAEPTTRPALESPHKTLRHSTASGETLAAPSKASELIGKAVSNAEGKSLGKVDDIAIDLESGRVSLVIVSTGGVLGVGSKDIAVPPSAFTYEPSSKNLRLNVDKDKFRDAPAFEKSRWDEQVQRDRLTQTYTYYGQEPYFQRADADLRTTPPAPAATPTQNPATRLDGTKLERPDVSVTRPADAIVESRQFDSSRTSPSQLGWLNKASAVIGMNVINQENKKCGEVDNLILDLETGRIVHVIISSGGVLGIGDTLNVVPPNVLRYNASRDAIQINLTKEQLAAAPNFKSSEWPNFGDPAYSGKVYRAYGVEPYFTTDADNTSRNVRDRQADRLSPLDQGKSEADVETTRQIRQQINDRDALSVNARNVKVITVNGRITLRGPVNSEEERAWIVELAKKHSRNGDVDDQLEIKRDVNNN
ncbi:MAG: PRC-barrel domain-containing protein [Verrucomicrobiales bacterium]|nr:PRC-barrel domain-containing protein [Verrucomicrobiales bacterium]